MSFNFEVEAGKSVKLTTAGKYCDRDIVVSATGGGGYTEEDLQAKYEEGKQAEYDRFWDEIQSGGEPRVYNNAFSGVTWNKERFKPKYKIVPDKTLNSAREMFQYFNYGEDNLSKLVELTYDMIDMSRCTQAAQVSGMFQNAAFYLIEIDLSAVTGTMTNLFQCNNGGRIYNIRLRTNSATFTNCFNNMNVLETLIFEDGSTISGNGFNVQWSTKLSKASIESVVNAMSTTTSGLSATFSKTAVNKAFETAEGANNGSTSAEWTALANTRSNWTINLV